MEVRRKAKITSKGQLTLPAAVREALKVKPGDVLTFDVGPDGVRVFPERSPGRFDPYVGKYRVGRGRTANQTNRWLAELRGHERRG